MGFEPWQGCPQMKVSFGYFKLFPIQLDEHCLAKESLNLSR